MTEKDRAGIGQIPTEYAHIQCIDGTDTYLFNLYNDIRPEGEGWAPGVDFINIMEATHAGQRGLATLLCSEISDHYTYLKDHWGFRRTKDDHLWSRVSDAEVIERLEIIQHTYLWAAWRYVENKIWKLGRMYGDEIESGLYSPDSELAVYLVQRIEAHKENQRALIDAIQNLNNLNYCKDVVEFAGIMMGGV